jgi:hypothetical protein
MIFFSGELGFMWLLYSGYGNSNRIDRLTRNLFASANGWKPFKTFSMVNWCGYGQQYRPWLQPGGDWLLVPVPGEAVSG